MRDNDGIVQDLQSNFGEAIVAQQGTLDDVPTLWTTLEVTTDLQSGRYLAIGLNNEERTTYDFNVTLSKDDFSVASLRRSGTR